MESSSNPTSPLLRGSCNCGQVTYVSSMLPLAISLCHCRNCRKTSGAPFVAFGDYQNTALRWHGPESRTKPTIKTTSSAIAIRGFCGDCGSTLFMKYHCRPDVTHIAMGTVDDGGVVGEIVKPCEHIFLKEKAAWWKLSDDDDDDDDDGIARHEGFDETFQRRLEEWEAKGSPRRASC